MKKLYLVLLAALLLAGCVGVMAQELEPRIYLPIAMKRLDPAATQSPTPILPPTETPTAIPDNTPTPTPTHIPVSIGGPVRFLGVDHNSPMEAVVVKAEYRSSMWHHFWGSVYPKNLIFVVVLIDITNYGALTDKTSLTSFALENGLGEQYMFQLKPSWVAEEEYQRLNYAEPIRSGGTLSTVVVFDIWNAYGGLELVPISGTWTGMPTPTD